MNHNRKVIVLGASPNPNRYSHLVTKVLFNQGYRTIPVGRRKGEINDTPIQLSLPEDKDIDTITLYLNPTIQLQYLEEIKRLKPSRVIFNPGAESDEIKEELEKSGIETLDACTLVMLRTNQF